MVIREQFGLVLLPWYLPVVLSSVVKGGETALLGGHGCDLGHLKRLSN